MGSSDKIVIIFFVVLFLAWFLYFFVWNKHEKIKWSELTFNFNFSPTSYMIVIIVLLLAMVIRQEIQMDDLKDQISSMESELSSDIQDVENVVRSMCN